MLYLQWGDVQVADVVIFFMIISLSAYVVYLCLLPIVVVTIIYAVLKLSKHGSRKVLDCKGRAVLITGCDTGFGHHLAKLLHKDGFVVFAGVLSDKSDGANALRNFDGLNVIQMDITKQNEIDDVIKEINSKGCGLWGVVNNAGYGMRGDVEYTPVEDFKRCAEVNFYGMIRVIQASLPMIRKSKGRIVNIASVRGQYYWPGWSVYHTTKYAVEVLSDSLRLEMRKFGVKVSIIEPGWFATGSVSPSQIARRSQEIVSFWDKASDEVKSAYGKEHFDNLIKVIEAANLKGAEVGPILNAIKDGLINVCPEPRYTVFGRTAYRDFLAMMHKYMPTWLADRIITWLAKYNHFIGDKNKEI